MRSNASCPDRANDRALWTEATDFAPDATRRHNPTVTRPICCIAVVVMAAMIAGCFDAERDDSGAVSSKGELSVFDLRVGDCLMNVTASGEQREVEAVPCAQPHDAEVYTNIELADGPFPGDTFIDAKADRGCVARLRRQAPRSKDEILYFVPNKRTWDEDDRTVTCIVEYPKRRRGTVAVPSAGR
jgi:hypothetical protein